MLKTIDSPEFDVTVTLNTKLIQGSFVMRCVGLPGPKIEALEKQSIADGKGPQGVLATVVKGHETVELFGEEIVFTGPESIERLTAYQGVGPAMLRAYHSALWEEASGN